MAGKAPVRPNWDGLLPVTGDGRYEWADFHDPFVLPHHVNPECGFVFSANEMNLPADYPAETRKLSFEWLEPWRARRIRSVLEDDAGHTLDASTRLQADVFSEPALRLGRLVAALPPADDAASRAAIHLLLGFDGYLHAESAAACLIETLWLRHLRPALVTALAPEPADADLFRPGDTETLLDALDHGHPAPRRSDAHGARHPRPRLGLARLRGAVRYGSRRMGMGPFPSWILPASPLRHRRRGQRECRSAACRRFGRLRDACGLPPP